MIRLLSLVPALALLIPGWVGVLLAALLCPAVLFVLHRLLLRKQPAVEDVTLAADVLLSGEREVITVMAPEAPTDRARINAGPSMLLLSHAALLTLPDGPEARAAERFFRGMKLDATALRQHMPLVQTLEQDGLRWQIHPDGPGFRAFACGGPELLSHCARIQGLQPGPLGHQQRERLTVLLAEAERPLCFAMAPVEDGRMGAPVYLGALVLREALQPWLEEELTLLTAQGRQVVLPEDIALRLNRPQPAPAYSLLFTLQAADGEGMVQLQPGERPSAWFAAEDRRRREELRAVCRRPIPALACMLLAALWLLCCGTLPAAAMTALVPFCLMQLLCGKGAPALWAAAAVLMLIAPLLCGASLMGMVFALAVGALGQVVGML